MMGLVLDRRAPQEGVARLGWFESPNSPREGTIMINNSSATKWDRLSHKQLDRQFVHEMVHGLQCSPFEAQAILEAVYFGDFLRSHRDCPIGGQ